MSRKNLKIIIIIFILTLIFYLPELLDPNLLFGHNNDLSQVFIPFYVYIRSNLFKFHTFPLWNNTILAGTPLASDPQFSLFYPLNWLFMVLPVRSAFWFYFLLHTFLAGLGMYFLAGGSFFAAAAYMFSPKFAGFLLAGHYGLIGARAWIPWLIFFALKLSQKPNLKNSILTSFCLAFIFLNHTIIFLIIAVCLGTFTLYELMQKNTQKLKLFIHFIFVGILTIGLTAGSLLPQLAWAGQSTRKLLWINPESYPLWMGKSDYLKHLLPFPDIDSEKIIYLGLIILILAVFQLRKKWIWILGIIILVISGNNLFGLDKTLPLVILRVSTRIWFIPTIITILLANQTLKNAKKRNLIAFLAAFELLLFSWATIIQPQENLNYRSPEFINAIKNENEIYRVFCTDRCIPQKQAVENNLELISGYNTLIQMNYFKHSWQLMGGYWNYYTLSLPPYGAIKYKEVNPDPESLGEYNTKYIISPDPLKNQDLKLINNTDNYYIYENLKYLSRVYTADSAKKVEINFYSPNKIIIDTANINEPVILAQTFSQGWKAIDNRGRNLEVAETPQALTKIALQNGSNYVTIFYDPPYYKLGKFLSLITYILIIYYFINEKSYKKLHKK